MKTDRMVLVGTFLMQAVQTPPKLQKTIFDLRATYGYFAGTPFIQPHLAIAAVTVGLAARAARPPPEYIHMYTCIYTYIYIYICIILYVCIYIYICIYVFV